MTTTTTPTTGVRPVAALFGVGGLLIALGGQLHPRGSGVTVDDHLASMLTGPTWTISHLTLPGVVGVLGGLACAAAGPRVALAGSAAFAVLAGVAIRLLGTAVRHVAVPRRAAAPSA